MADTKLSALTALILPAADDELYIRDISESASAESKKMTHDDVLFGANGTPSTQAHGDSAAIGSALDAARSDHKHAMPAAGGASPHCIIGDASLQSLADNTEVAINFDEESHDTDTMHDPSTNNTRITFTTAGTYQGFFTINFRAASSSGERRLIVQVNGSIRIAQAKVSNPDGNDDDTIQVNWAYRASADDYLECLAYQNSGDASDSRKDGLSYPNGFATRIEGA